MFILLLLGLLLPELYIWHYFMRGSHWLLQLVFWMPYLATVVLMLLFNSPYNQAWMFRWGVYMILCFAIPKLLFTLVSLVGLAMRALSPVTWRAANVVALLIAVSVVGIVVYGLCAGWRRLTVKEVELKFADLPQQFDGYRIVQMSDMHIGTYHAAPEAVKRIVDEVNALQPDMICFTGDLVNSSPSELDIFDDDLSRLKAKDGVFSIMGNHDYCMYNRHSSQTARMKAIAEVKARERRYGWQLLLNEHKVVHRGGDSIAIVGVENSSRPPFPDYGNLAGAMECAEGQLPEFKVLLSHDPTHWRREVLKKTDIQLQLSGHTHATQFRLFGWSPASFVYDEYAGLYEEQNGVTEAVNEKKQKSDSRKLFICTGTGGNVTFRFGAWPEIVVITLKKA